MALTINTNLMALNASRNLGAHYSNLSTSIRRLSSGLRVGTAADDAAGLAIRELMRAEIAGLNQGIRNANDAISMIQTMDGALGVIDEKLIRMKELAEQAATGTYNSDQRMMIDNEFQAMKSEITRIARATDFNDIKLLCDDVANKLYVGVGQEVTVGTPSIEGGTLVNPDAATADANIRYAYNRWSKSVSGDSAFNLWRVQSFAVGHYLYAMRDDFTEPLTFSYTAATETWTVSAGTVAAYAAKGITLSVSDAVGSDSNRHHLFIEVAGTSYNGGAATIFALAETMLSGETDALTKDMTVTLTPKAADWEFFSGQDAYPNITYLSTGTYDLDGDGVADVTGATSGGFNVRSGITYAPASDYVTKIHFGTGNDSAEDYYYILGTDCTAEGLGLGDTRVQTQQNAQEALEEINEAIIKKDSARAYFGAMQNRLENTISNLMIQGENIQAAESRISDVDVASEMTGFVRSQVLTNAAIAMLSQANSLPQMALSLIS